MIKCIISNCKDMEDNKDKIYEGPELTTVTTNGIPGVMAAGCLVPVDPKKQQYMIYSPYTNQDYITSMDLVGDRKDGPTLSLTFKNVRNRNFYVFLMQCTPFLAKGKSEGLLSSPCYAYVVGDSTVNYDFYIIDFMENRTDLYYTFFLPCIE